jgi:hypothetical protein
MSHFGRSVTAGEVNIDFKLLLINNSRSGIAVIAESFPFAHDLYYVG